MMRYVAYGSNLHPGRLAGRIEATLLGTARLDGWRLQFLKRSVDRSAKCTITPDDAAAVWVAVYELASMDMSGLDRIEGVGNGYDRMNLSLPGFGPCTTYVGTHLDPDLAPYHWYKNLVIAGCRFHGFPADYVQSIEAVQSEPDPDPERTRLNEQLLAGLRGKR